MGKITDKCFVCEKELQEKSPAINSVVMLPVCSSCKDTTKEKDKEEEILDSLADGLVCGCI